MDLGGLHHATAVTGDASGSGNVALSTQICRADRAEEESIR
jgi:hypothetical protein